MLLSVTAAASGVDARDLGYLMAKHPERAQSFPLAFGEAWVYYPVVSAETTTMVLQVEVDPIGLVRNRRFRDEGFALAAYVNDRPYAASSLLSVAMKRVLGSALAGTCKERPDLVDHVWDLTIELPAVPGHGLVAPLFEPLGWTVEVDRLDAGGLARVVLRGRSTVATALGQLYVLLPVLDGSKHYWVDAGEVDKLLNHGGTWLPTHPRRDLITHRYFAGQRSLAQDATERLLALDDTVTDDASTDEAGDIAATEPTPRPPALVTRRKQTVADVLIESGARRIVDVGCGEGALIKALLHHQQFEHILGLDVSARELARAERNLNLDRMSDRQRARVTLGQSSVNYVDPRVKDADAAVLMEVIEHLDPERLSDLDTTVFADGPGHVVVTTPNVEYNAVYPDTGSRHHDHRFEWTRDEFRTWATRVADAHGYTVTFRPIGDEHPDYGPPTQLAWFAREAR